VKKLTPYLPLRNEKEEWSFPVRCVIFEKNESRYFWA